jgi:sugar/nucleoside kinase (ribokinase family)
VRLVPTAAAGTAYGLVLAPPGRDRVFLEYPGCNMLYQASDLPTDLLAQSRLLHFGYPPLMAALLADQGDELVTLLQQATTRGVITSLDMTLPDPQSPAGQVDWPQLLARVLPVTDLFTPSAEELLYMLAPQQWAQFNAQAADGEVLDAIPESLLAELADQCLALGAGVALVKAGHRGALLHTAAQPRLPAAADCRQWANCRHRLAALTADRQRVVNACGAGDVAIGAFLTALGRGAGPLLAGHLAMMAGRDNLYGADPLSGLRPWPVMLAAADEALSQQAQGDQPPPSSAP